MMISNAFRNGYKIHHHMNTICRRHSNSGSVGVPIHKIHVQQELQVSKAFYSRFNGRRTKEMEFHVPFHSFSAKTYSLFLLKASQLSLVYTAADLTSQTMTRLSLEPYDVIRTCRMAGYGLIILGPTLHLWFNFLSRVFPKKDVFTTLKKIFMGQTIYGPIMMVVFFSINAALQGEKCKEIVARLKRDMLPTMINNVIYWPMCEFIIFRFVPVPLQPLVSNLFSYVWTIYITYMANLAKVVAN
ncbi:unnamed protein product [Lactuca saligna]|uniref:Uncharacterized protein n=1 Tax=Lactuca saligna TaxID=75948 RepID=A0AA36A434_LACSI|nr:unnamed protein product [Lactuca saligna]